MIEIENGVPVPALIGGRRGGNNKYRFGDMKVGDSFVQPRARENRVRSAAMHYGKTHGKKFTCQVREENGHRVIRVWRIE